MIKEIFKIGTLGKAAFNKEFMSIYYEVKPVFTNWIRKVYPFLVKEDIDDVFNDSMIAFYEKVGNGELDDFQGSVHSLIFTIGRNKVVDLIRKKQPGRQLEVSAEVIDKFSNIEFDEFDEVEQEKKNVITNIVRRLEEPCRKILFMFYYHSFSMTEIAEEMQYKNADVAKTKKNICMNRVKAVAKNDFVKRGFI